MIPSVNILKEKNERANAYSNAFASVEIGQNDNQATIEYAASQQNLDYKKQTTLE